MDRSQPRRMPRRRTSVTRSFAVGATDGLLTSSLFPDGTVGHLDLRTGPHGSTVAGLADALSGAMTLGLQQGAPLEDYVQRLMGLPSEPLEPTDDAELPWATSVPDYVVRRLAVDHLPREVRHGLGVRTRSDHAVGVADPAED